MWCARFQIHDFRKYVRLELKLYTLKIVVYRIHNPIQSGTPYLSSSKVKNLRVESQNRNSRYHSEILASKSEIPENTCWETVENLGTSWSMFFLSFVTDLEGLNTVRVFVRMFLLDLVVGTNFCKHMKPQYVWFLPLLVRRLDPGNTECHRFES